MNYGKIYSAYTEINLDNLVANYKIAQKKAKGAHVLAVIKADAYNHGAVVAAKKLFSHGACHFAVANIDEGIELRENGIDGMILVLGPALPERYADAAKYDISLAVCSYEELVFADKFTKDKNCALKIHLALNTGMNRVGLCAESDEISNVCENCANIIKQNRNIITEGIFSHFCDIENTDTAFSEKQYDSFVKTVKLFEENGVNFKIRHISNSGATMNHPEFRCDLVRFGIALYGCEFSDGGVLPVLSFKTHIAQITSVKKGETVGYGRTYTAEKDMKIATITAGYADGVNRLLSNKGSVLVRGKRAPIVGRVCMDMTMIDITDIPDASVFDDVTIIGRDGNESITAEEHASICGTISYEILCSIGKRVKRTYIGENE